MPVDALPYAIWKLLGLESTLHLQILENRANAIALFRQHEEHDRQLVREDGAWLPPRYVFEEPLWGAHDSKDLGQTKRAPGFVTALLDLSNCHWDLSRRYSNVALALAELHVRHVCCQVMRRLPIEIRWLVYDIMEEEATIYWGPYYDRQSYCGFGPDFEAMENWQWFIWRSCRLLEWPSDNCALMGSDMFNKSIKRCIYQEMSQH